MEKLPISTSTPAAFNRSLKPSNRIFRILLASASKMVKSMLRLDNSSSESSMAIMLVESSTESLSPIKEFLAPEVDAGRTGR